MFDNQMPAKYILKILLNNCNVWLAVWLFYSRTNLTSSLKVFVHVMEIAQQTKS